MVDKVWYDWQHANAANFWSFDGGATAQVTNFIADPNFPNGAPPYVTVSKPLTSAPSVNQPSHSLRRRSRQMAS